MPGKIDDPQQPISTWGHDKFVGRHEERHVWALHHRNQTLLAGACPFDLENLCLDIERLGTAVPNAHVNALRPPRFEVKDVAIQRHTGHSWPGQGQQGAGHNDPTQHRLSKHPSRTSSNYLKSLDRIRKRAGATRKNTSHPWAGIAGPAWVATGCPGRESQAHRIGAGSHRLC